MKRVVQIKGIVFLSILMAQGLTAQELQNLDFLRDNWSVSYNESNDSILILRNTEDAKFLTEEDKKVIYPFNFENDSALCEVNFPYKRDFYCISGHSEGLSDKNSIESWSINRDNSLLKHSICVKDIATKESPCLYETTYEIKGLKKGYLKLSLQQEQVNGL